MGLFNLPPKLFGDDIIGKDIFDIFVPLHRSKSVQFAQMKSAYSVLFGGDEIQWFLRWFVTEKINGNKWYLNFKSCP